MPVIKVWCLPPNQDERKLKLLHERIVKAVVSIKVLGLKNENDMTCLFVPDLMQYGLGTEIVVEIFGLFEKPERTQSVLDQLAFLVGKAVSESYPSTKKVECFVYPFNRKAQGFWSLE